MAEAFHLQLSSWLRLDAIFESCVCALVEQDLPCRCRVAEPGGEVRHRSERTVVVASLEPDLTERRVTRGDPGAELSEIGKRLWPNEDTPVLVTSSSALLEVA